MTVESTSEGANDPTDNNAMDVAPIPPLGDTSPTSYYGVMSSSLLEEVGGQEGENEGGGEATETEGRERYEVDCVLLYS